MPDRATAGLRSRRRRAGRGDAGPIDEIVDPGVTVNPADDSYGEQVLKPALAQRPGNLQVVGKTRTPASSPSCCQDRETSPGPSSSAPMPPLAPADRSRHTLEDEETDASAAWV
jgi:hypothetical protein